MSVQREVNRIPRAELTLRDGDAAEQKFAISDTEFLCSPAATSKFAWDGRASKKTVFNGPGGTALN